MVRVTVAENQDPEFSIDAIILDEDEMADIYCGVCGTCGVLECDGIKSFLEHHVRGKTDCLNEDDMLNDIIYHFENRNQESELTDVSQDLPRTTENQEADRSNGPQDRSI